MTHQDQSTSLGLVLRVRAVWVGHRIDVGLLAGPCPLVPVVSCWKNSPYPSDARQEYCIYSHYCN